MRAVVAMITNRRHRHMGRVMESVRRELGHLPLWVVREGRTRGEARQIAIDRAKAAGYEWIIFVDDDFELNPGWWGDVSKHMEDPGVGLVWGVNYDADESRRRWIQFLYRKGLYERDYVSHLIHAFMIRGGTHDTAIRLKALRKRIPRWLHVYEDWWIKREVERNGYRCVVSLVGGVHYSGGHNYNPRNIASLAWHDVVVMPHRLGGFRRRLKSLLATPLYFAYRFMATRSLTGSLRYALYDRTLYNIASMLYMALGGHEALRRQLLYGDDGVGGAELPQAPQGPLPRRGGQGG